MPAMIVSYQGAIVDGRCGDSARRGPTAVHVHVHVHVEVAVVEILGVGSSSTSGVHAMRRWGKVRMSMSGIYVIHAAVILQVRWRDGYFGPHDD